MSGSRCLVEVAPLDDLAAQAVAAGEAWLSREEARRLDAMTSATRRRQFLAGHWLVRRLAANTYGGAPDDWLLLADAEGRPRIRTRDFSAAASLSHSGPWIAAAVAERPVGLDLEFPRKPRDLLALAGFVFSPDECQHLACLAEASRSEAFHAFWTLKEARGKRGGEGLQPAKTRRITSMPCAAAEADALHWPLPDDGCLALAAWPGVRVEGAGFDAESAPSFWRYVAVPD